MPVASGKARSRSARDQTQSPQTAGVRAMQGGNGSKRSRPNSVEDLFGGGQSGNLILPEFDRENVYAWFQKRHRQSAKLISDDGYYRRGDHEWKVPYGVRLALKKNLIYGQIAVKYPFYATWLSPKTGHRLKKNFTSLIGAVHFCATKAQYVDPHCSVVAKVVGYEVPAKLRGKFPLKRNGKTYYWCPYCMDARRFRRVNPVREFYAIKKFWSEEKQKYIFKDVKLAVLQCTCCGITNQDPKFRHSNQPFELRRIKQGVRRVKRRRK